MVTAIWHNKAVYERFNMPHTTWLAKLVQAVRTGSVKKRAAINVLVFFGWLSSKYEENRLCFRSPVRVTI